MGFLYCDFETQSACNINEPDYLSHSTTRVITFQYAVDNGPVKLWVNPMTNPPKRVIENFKADTRPAGKLAKELQALAKRHTFVAHNGEMFDSRLARRFFALDNLAEWEDTLHTLRRNGLPGKLETSCEFMGVAAKGDGEYIKKFMSAKYRHGEVVYPTNPESDWLGLCQYAIEDIIALRELHRKLSETFDKDDAEDAILATHKRINARGFKVDYHYAKALLDRWEDIGEEARTRIAEITELKLTGDDIRSPAKIKAYLENHLGVRLLSIDKRSIDDLLDGATLNGKKLPDKAIEILQLRKEANRNSMGKTAAFLEHANKDSVITNWANYFGAHTGRWSGRGVQPHNFTRGVKVDVTRFDAPESLTLPALRAHAKELSTQKLKISIADILSTLARNCVVPMNPKKVFGIVDYAAIEARGVAWLAQCDTLLDIFTHGRDVYCEFATNSLFGRLITKKDAAERQAAKIIVLGCGYQMGANKFGMMAEMLGADLDAIGLSPKKCVDAYRKAYPEIVQLWRAVQNAAHLAVKHPGNVVAASYLDFESNGEHLAMTLPSGRSIRYWMPEIKMEYPTAFDSDKPLPVLYYRNPYGFDEGLYGGKLVENAVQGFCRDILASKAVVLESLGYSLPLHVHDELVAELDKPKDIHEMAAVMSTTKDFWYEDFPLEVEGFTARRYTKSPYKDSLEVKYRKGEKV